VIAAPMPVADVYAQGTPENFEDVRSLTR